MMDQGLVDKTVLRMVAWMGAKKAALMGYLMALVKETPTVVEMADKMVDYLVQG